AQEGPGHLRHRACVVQETAQVVVVPAHGVVAEDLVAGLDAVGRDDDGAVLALEAQRVGSDVHFERNVDVGDAVALAFCAFCAFGGEAGRGERGQHEGGNGEGSLGHAGAPCGGCVDCNRCGRPVRVRSVAQPLAWCARACTLAHRPGARACRHPPRCPRARRSASWPGRRVRGAAVRPPVCSIPPMEPRMHVVMMVLLFLLAVVVSGFIARLLPLKMPLPLLQIALGAGLSWIGFDVAFDPHLFLLLFIPPLLFLDGWRIPKGAFFRDWKPILALAIGLVVFTVVGMGWFIEWFVPAMPLAVAFALAAILSPTDPVAVAAMTHNSPLPPRL